MTFSRDRLTLMFLGFFGQRRIKRNIAAKLNLATLSERELADLNLPPEVRGRLLGVRHSQWRHL
jgi:hypothetical protein